MPKVYTLGYAQPGALQRLEELMADPSNEPILIIDARIEPISNYHPWHGDDLKRDWGDRYLQAGDFLGNPNAFNGGPLSINNPVRGINGLLYHLSRGRSVILLCGCKHYEQCHLSVIIERLKIGFAKTQLDVEVVSNPFIEVMKCFSIKPPFAEWICLRDEFVKHGVTPKVHENRDYGTKYRTTDARSRVLIHSSHSTKAYIEESLFTWSRCISGLTSIVPTTPDGYRETSGKIIGVADLVDVVEGSDDPWFLGPCGWMFKNAQLLKEPIPYSGKLGLFDVPLSVVAGVLPLPLSQVPTPEQNAVVQECIRLFSPSFMEQSKRTRKKKAQKFHGNSGVEVEGMW